jgi:hypothetical protein
MDTATIVLLALVSYKAVLIAVGWWASQRNQSDLDFSWEAGSWDHGSREFLIALVLLLLGHYLA